MAATAPLLSTAEDKATAEVKEGVALRLPVVEIDERDSLSLSPNSDARVKSQVNLTHQPGQNEQTEPGSRDGPDFGAKTGLSEDAASTGQTRGNEMSSEGDSGEEDEDDMWENESFVEAAFEQLEDSHVPLPSDQNSSDECTLQESLAYRRLLRQVGVEEFIRQTLESETVSAKKLCTAFGIHVPFLEGSPDDAYYRLLGLAIQRELQKRLKLEQWNTIEDAVGLLKNAKNIIVVTGAGISTSLGIPDFRSKHNGLYSKLEHLGLDDPQEVFEIGLFREDPTIFFSVAKDILPETKKFTPTHAFIRILQDKGKLLVNYTQNIDNIEGHAGVSASKLIQCHGSFATATCQKCGHKVNGDEIHDDIKAGITPKCNACVYRTQQFKPIALKRKRSSDHRSKSRQRGLDESSSEEDFAEEPGIMKPDITFFGENLPDTFHDRLKETDYSTVDLVIVIGTSLKVAPVAEIPNFVSAQNESIPQIYVSRDPCKHIAFDIELLGECDVVVSELCRRAGWTLDHEMGVAMDKEIDVTNAGDPWRWEVAVKEEKVDIEALTKGL